MNDYVNPKLQRTVTLGTLIKRAIAEDYTDEVVIDTLCLATNTLDAVEAAWNKSRSCIYPKEIKFAFYKEVLIQNISLLASLEIMKISKEYFDLGMNSHLTPTAITGSRCTLSTQNVDIPIPNIFSEETPINIAISKPSLPVNNLIKSVMNKVVTLNVKNEPLYVRSNTGGKVKAYLNDVCTVYSGHNWIVLVVGEGDNKNDYIN